MLAREIANLAILWVVLIARRGFSDVVRIELAACGGAVAGGVNWVHMDVVYCLHVSEDRTAFEEPRNVRNGPP